MTPAPIIDALVSFHYYRQPTAMTDMTASGRIRLIADSGAYSAYSQGSVIKLAEYATWLRRWKPNLYWCASLDVFGDAAATYTNWATLRDTYGLETVPTLHIGADPRLMDPYVAQGVDFLGLGGMVGLPTGRILRWLVHVLRYARDRHPNVRFHTWGLSAPSILAKLPLYSTDCSRPLSKPFRYGVLPLWDPAARTTLQIALDGRTPHLYRSLLLGTYSTDPAAIARATPTNRALTLRLAVRSTQLWAAHLQHLHRTPPPRWGINTTHPPPPGTRLHLVDTDYTRLRQIAAAAQERP